jgi:hypothetical protein
MRAGFAYLTSEPGDDWQAAFWNNEQWLLPMDLFGSFMQHSWWTGRRHIQGAYPGNGLGVWYYWEDVRPPDINFDGDILGDPHYVNYHHAPATGPDGKPD